MKTYDLVVVGAGPAGLSAAIYAARYKLDVVVIGKISGGLASTAHKVCNYPSYIEISGFDLMNKFLKQVKELGVNIINEEVISISKEAKDFSISTKKNKYSAKKIIFAGGTARSKLNAKNEDKFVGKGVSYCSSCDAAFFRDKRVIVAGGGDAALTASLLLSEYATKVYIVYRGDSFKKADPTWMDLVSKNKKISPIFNDEIIEINGKINVEGVILKSSRVLSVEGVFVEIGGVPDIYSLSNLKIERDPKGYIVTDKCQRTNINGFFAAGDITNNCLKQIVVAAGEGATAAFQCFKDIRSSV